LIPTIDHETALAEQVRMRKEGLLAPEIMVRKYSDVPADQRKRMFWVADKEQADAWIKYHNLWLSKSPPGK
jgi:uncharacterized membrane protein